MCIDNFFTSYNLAKLLLQENLTLLGTTRKHRREVPGSSNRKIKIYSSKFLFNYVNGICLVIYQANKNKNPIMLLSSSHADNLVATNETKKPVIILDYNKRKEGVDMFNQNLEEFSRLRKTVRFLQYFFFYNTGCPKSFARFYINNNCKF